MALNAKTMTNKELFYGHKACPGCGAALAIRLALKVLGERAIAVIPPNCMSTVAFIYPHMPLYVNGMIPPFAGTAAAMSGILAGAKAQGLEATTLWASPATAARPISACRLCPA